MRFQHSHADIRDLVFLAGDGHKAHAVLRRNGVHRICGALILAALAVVLDQEGADLAHVGAASRDGGHRFTGGAARAFASQLD
ncbi:hypothetical protein D3C72_2385950 [compost metagenome]